MDPHLKLEFGSDTEVSRILLGDHPAFPEGREAPLFGCVYDEGTLWRADETGIWREVTHADTSKLVMSFDGMMKPSSSGGETPYKVNAGTCVSVRKLVEAQCDAPGFFNDGKWGVAFRRTFLAIDQHGATSLEPLTEKHRCRFALDFDYDACAAAPSAFIAFMRSLWDDDIEQMNLLLEWIGYLLCGRTDLQKIFLLIGPTRSGKGTILRLIQRLFGRSATSFKVAKLGSDRWMLGSLVGKAVAYDPDVRRASINDNESESVEALLSVSGEDFVTCERKYEHSNRFKLGARLMLGTNPPFAIRDVGGALSGRLLLCTMFKSFLGREDTTLDARLAAEIPGIVRLAVLALQVLSARGRFIEPASSAETRKQVEQAESPLLAFVEDRCEIGDASHPDFTCGCQALYDEFGKWCQDNGMRKISNSNFAGTLRRLEVKQVRTTHGSSRKRIYAGIRLLPGELPIGRPKVVTLN